MEAQAGDHHLDLPRPVLIDGVDHCAVLGGQQHGQTFEATDVENLYVGYNARPVQ